MYFKFFYLFILIGKLHLCHTQKPAVIEIEPKIVGGVDSIIDNTKYQISLRLKRGENPFGNGHICGGSLISNSTVLTAAHCLFYKSLTSAYIMRSPNEFQVVMGTLNRYEQTPNTLVFNVKGLAVHSSYDPVNLLNDIAVLHLDSQVPSNHPTVQPVSLASYIMKTGTECQIHGWGTTYYEGPNNQKTLKTANISIVDKYRCTRSYPEQIQPGMLCAGDWSGYYDACQGDSGGPLTCNNLLTGIVSWGNECGRANYPGVYTDIYFYRRWIFANNKSSNNCFASLNLTIVIFYLFYYGIDYLSYI